MPFRGKFGSFSKLSWERSYSFSLLLIRWRWWIGNHDQCSNHGDKHAKTADYLPPAQASRMNVAVVGVIAKSFAMPLRVSRHMAEDVPGLFGSSLIPRCQIFPLLELLIRLFNLFYTSLLGHVQYLPIVLFRVVFKWEHPSLRVIQQSESLMFKLQLSLEMH